MFSVTDPGSSRSVPELAPLAHNRQQLPSELLTSQNVTSGPRLGGFTLADIPLRCFSIEGRIMRLLPGLLIRNQELCPELPLRINRVGRPGC